MKKTKLSYWLKSGFFTISERLSAMVLGLGTFMMLSRYFEKAEFGIWVIFLTITAILEVGRIGLLANGLIKYLSNSSKEEYGKILTASFVLNGIITGAIVLFLYTFSSWIGHLFDMPQLAEMLKIYCLATVLLIPFFQFNFLQQANLDFKGVFFSTMTKQGILFGFVAFIFFQNEEMLLTNLAWVLVWSAIAASFVSFLFAYKFIKISWKIDWKWVKTLFDYGKFVFGTNMSTMIYKSIDKMMLGGISSAGAVAVSLYEAAIKVTNLTDVPTFAMANILFPQSARQAKDGAAASKNLYEKAVGAILAIMIPSVIFVEFFAEFIVVFIAGAKYYDAANILRLTILYGLFMPFAVQFGTVLDSVGSPKINFRFTLLSMILNVIFNYIFIVQFGVYGAAFGTLTTYFVVFWMMRSVLKKKFDVSFMACFTNVLYFYKMAWELINKQLFKKNNLENTLPPSETPPVELINKTLKSEEIL